MTIKIEGYHYIESLNITEKSESFGFGRYENEIDGKPYEILWCKNADQQSASVIKRVFNDIKSLTGSAGIQEISKVHSDGDISYIVYECINSNPLKFTRDEFMQCVTILDSLKKKNRQGFILDENTITKNDEGNIKLRFVGLYELFYKGIIQLPKKFQEKRLRLEDDIRNLSSLFQQCFCEDQNLKDIFQKCQDGKYSKYCDLQQDIEALPPIKNLDYDTMGIVGKEDIGSLDELANEMNRGCWWIIKEKLSKKGGIEIQWSTKTISGIAYVSENDDGITGYLFIPHKNEYPNEDVLNDGERAKFNFESGENKEYSIEFFNEKYENANKLAELYTSKKKTVEEWILLPKKEKEYIEENAFKADYISRKPSKSNSENIRFTLTDDFKNWEKIKEKKNEKTQLLIDDNIIGEILDYKPDQNYLIIKDFQGDLNTIPDSGKLVEDVRQLTSQYKKQIEACDRFKEGDIVNPDLSSIIATPDAPLPQEHFEIDFDTFEPFNSNLENDETQKNTVIASIHQKPIYLIQGPPGTGKTTEINEIVQQLIKQNKDIKILIVSQSNMAVDNVLQRLPKDMLFMRLASEHSLEDISSEVKEHTFEEKLKKWIGDTEKNVKDNLEKFIDKKKFDPVLLELYKQYKSKPSIDEFKKTYRKGMMCNYAEKLFGNAKSEKEIKDIFYDKIGKEYLQIQELQDRWLAFIRNASSIDKNKKHISFLKNGSEDIAFHIAYTKSMNVLGATCIHIASAKYSDFNFKFDRMIMDESSKATNAEALVPINMSKNLILIGDHKQLPPVVTKEKEVRQKIKKEAEDDGLDIDKTYGISLFETLFDEFQKDNNKQNFTTMLDIQYRMPRQLGHLISKYIYEGKLKNPSLAIIKDYDLQKSHNINLKLKTVPIGKEQEQVPNSIIVISTSNKENPTDNGNKFNRWNECNAKVIDEILSYLQQDNKSPREIGVIAAYRGQVELLKEYLLIEKYKPLKIVINTVDQFQGSERDIIIYDLVRSSKGNDNIGFLDDYRRINVAFSRAKKLLIVVGDSEFIIKRAKANPQSNIKTKDLVIRKIIEQLQDWGCVYESIEQAIEHE